jgi:hypothetical protein
MSQACRSGDSDKNEQQIKISELEITPRSQVMENFTPRDIPPRLPNTVISYSTVEGVHYYSVVQSITLKFEFRGVG